MAERKDLDVKIIEQLDDLDGNKIGQSNFDVILGTIGSAANLKDPEEIMMSVINAVAMLASAYEDFDIDDLEELESAVHNLMRESTPDVDPLIKLSPQK